MTRFGEDLDVYSSTDDGSCSGSSIERRHSDSVSKAQTVLHRDERCIDVQLAKLISSN